MIILAKNYHDLDDHDINDVVNKLDSFSSENDLFYEYNPGKTKNIVEEIQVFLDQFD